MVSADPHYMKKSKNTTYELNPIFWTSIQKIGFSIFRIKPLFIKCSIIIIRNIGLLSFEMKRVPTQTLLIENFDYDLITYESAFI